MSDTAWTTVVDVRITRILSLGALTLIEPPTIVSGAFSGSSRSMHRLAPHIAVPDVGAASGAGSLSPWQPTSTVAAVTAKPCRIARREQRAKALKARAAAMIFPW